ncbi:MAG: hypothetical protein Tsb002_03800 [Wenzhouxiangellaceae bacterium]
MILEGNQRGGARRLALHLMSDENEHVELHDIRGFVSDDLLGAFKESYALSRGTKCRQHLFSLSLNPPPGESVPTAAFEEAVVQIEDKLGLTGQPRVVVFHEKQGRRHAHVVWSRIDTQAMRAVHLPHTKKKLMSLARALYIKHGWRMPRGMTSSQERSPANYTLAQWQQAKRIGKNKAQISTALQDAWAISGTQDTFAQALKLRGYVLARGERSRIVVVDYFGAVYAIAKWTGHKARDIRAKVTDSKALPSVAEARQRIAQTMTGHLQALRDKQKAAVSERTQQLETERITMTARHRTARKAMAEAQDRRRQEMMRQQTNRPTGWQKLWGWISGTIRKRKKLRQWQAYQAAKHDQVEKDRLIFSQLEERQRLERRIERLRHYEQVRGRDLQNDLQQYLGIQQGNHQTYSNSLAIPLPPER